MKTTHPSAPYYVRAFALSVPIFLTAIQLWTWLLFVPGMVRTGTADFRQAYAAACILRKGQRTALYDYATQEKTQTQSVTPEPAALPYVSPAYEAFLLQPLSFLKFRTAYVLFVLINTAALVGCYFLLRQWMGNIARVYWWLPIAIFTGFLPLAAALMQGQDSIFLTLLLATAYRAATKDRDATAGVLTGLALFKFSIVIPLAILLLVWRRWRFVAGLCVTAIGLALACVAITGLAGQRQYALLIFSLAGIHNPPVPLATYPVHWNLMANLHGLSYGLLHRWIAEQQISHMALAISLALLAWVALRARRVKDTGTLLLIAIPAAVLASHHSYIHDLSPLIIPIIVVLNRFLPNEGLAGASKLQVRCAALLFLAPVVYSYATQEFWIVSLAVLLLLLSMCRAEFGEVGVRTSDPGVRETVRLRQMAV